MLGALIGDIAGSRFEWHNRKSKEFTLFRRDSCRLTDDSVMTLAVAAAILDCGGDWDGLSAAAVRRMQELGRRYPRAGYGGTFRRWIRLEDPQPYNSFGNGAAMRVSPCGWAASSAEEAKALARAVTCVTHDHPEGMKAAQAVAEAIFLARQGMGLPELRAHVTKNWYVIGFTLDEIRADYDFDVTCQGSVPQAFEALFESTGFEDAVRCAISIGGDSDTIGAITGSMAEAVYGIPEDLRVQALEFPDPFQAEILSEFESRYGRK